MNRKMKMLSTETYQIVVIGDSAHKAVRNK